MRQGTTAIFLHPPSAPSSFSLCAIIILPSLHLAQGPDSNPGSNVHPSEGAGDDILPKNKVATSTLHARSIPWSSLCPKPCPGAIQAGTDPNQADDGMVRMRTGILEPPLPKLTDRDGGP